MDPHSPAFGRLALSLTTLPGQFLADAVTPVVEIDGAPQRRPWGNHLFELAPGAHGVRVWFEYLFTKQACLAQLWIPVHAGYDTFARYTTALIVYSAGSLVVLGQQPFPPPQAGWGR